MFYLIDKPIGISSFDVIRRLRKILDTKKMGYLGTLDPLASGCLLVATHGSTKLLSLLEKSEKTYLFEIRIDGVTESLDLGTPIESCNIDTMIPRTISELREFLLSQTTQIPPKYSALHIDGVRAYELARQWVDIEIPSREVRVVSVDIIASEPPYFNIRMRISSGWYIRSFAPLIGEFFWTRWWYITTLRRESIHTNMGDLSLSLAQPLDDFSSGKFLDYSSVFPHISCLDISEWEYQDLLLGKVLHTDKIYKNWQKFFLRYKDIFYSLVSFSGDAFVIERNNV